MSPKLKPLLLPQMVEDRRKLELLQQQQHQYQQQQQQQQYQQQLLNDVDQIFMFSSQSSSSSDLRSPSPLTPTFSRSHSRYSGSTSSLEMIASTGPESPASPAQAVHPGKNMSHLPDVQEDPSERDEDNTLIPDHNDSQFGLYDCLCELGRLPRGL